MDIPTLTLVVAIASLLHAIVLFVFFFFAERYGGIGFYLISTILSALAFLCFLIRLLNPDYLFLRLLGNIFLCVSPLCYAIAISRFIGWRDRRFLYTILATVSIIFQIYFIYIDNNFWIRNFNIILIADFAYLATAYFLLKQKHLNLQVSVNFTIAVLLINTIMLAIRIIAIPLTSTPSLFTSNIVNASTFWTVFVGDYLRHAGFLMMVCQRLYGDLRKVAYSDDLTGLLNRRATNLALVQSIRDRDLFSVVLLDVDHFKTINDCYGHPGGDCALKHLSLVLQNNLKSPTPIGRWGGEEFLIILPQIPLKQAHKIAEKIRLAVAKNSCPEPQISFTISLGVATFPHHGNTPEKLIARADKALYEAKSNGRNQVAIASV